MGRVAVGVVAMLLVFTGLFSTIREDSRFGALYFGIGGRLTILRPDNWIDRTFPLAPGLADGEMLMRGRWHVILITHECPRCRELLDTVRRQSYDARCAIAVVDLAPDAAIDQAIRRRSFLFTCITDTSRQWVVETPRQVDICDGVVERVLPPGVLALDDVGWQ